MTIYFQHDYTGGNWQGLLQQIPSPAQIPVYSLGLGA